MTSNKRETKRRPVVTELETQDHATHGLKREYSKDKSKCQVTFWLPKEAAPEARCIALAGTFNNWNEKSHIMNKRKNGDFVLKVELDADQEYTFRFLIDEVRWENAWNADKYVGSAYGGCENSVIIT